MGISLLYNVISYKQTSDPSEFTSSQSSMSCTNALLIAMKYVSVSDTYQPFAEWYEAFKYTCYRCSMYIIRYRLRLVTHNGMIFIENTQLCHIGILLTTSNVSNIIKLMGFHGDPGNEKKNCSHTTRHDVWKTETVT
jgi:hypothetical protein